MRSVDALLAELHDLGVTLEADGERLRVRAPRAVMSADLTREIRERKQEVLARLAPVPQPALQRLAEAPHFELSHGQRRIWVLSQLDEGSAAYNVPLHQRLVGPLDVQALTRALEQLGARHESLRTTFEVRDGEPRQLVYPDSRLRLEHIDLTKHPAPDAAAAELGRRHAREPLDLEHGPLLRTALIRLGDERFVLLITAHHIIIDGVSIDVLARDLSRLYAAARRSEPPDLLELRVQYRDYARWQNERLRRGVLDAERDYWHRVLAGPLPVLGLPTDRPRPRVQTFDGQELAFTIPESVLTRLIGLGRRSRASLFMVLLALLDTLLHRYTGETDILVGTPVAGREHPDLEPQVGFYLNMLALRTRVDGRVSFETLLGRVRQTATAAYDHQQYPFDRLVDELGLARDLSRGAVFDVVVILQSQPDAGFDFEQIEARADFAHPGTSKFDLTFCFKRAREGLTLCIEYNTDLFASERIRRMGAHYLELARGVAEAPQTAVNRLPMLTCEERSATLWGLGCADAFAHPPGTVVDLLERQAARTPEAVAVEGPDVTARRWETVTYAGLQARANRLAHELRAMGVGAGARVAIGLERSIDMLVAVLGVLKAGATYVPLDPAFPPARLAFMIEDCGAELLISGEVLDLPLSACGARLLRLDRDRARLAAHAETSPTARPHPSCPAYVIYTSGSTGRPKGVVISHRALLDFLLSIGRRIGLGEGQAVLAVTTLAFDIAALELLGPLAAGGRIVLADRATATDATRLGETLGARGVNLMQATPATWRMLVDSGWPGDPHLIALCGGEALDRVLALALAARVGTLWNLYGPTEAAVWSAAYRVREQGLAAWPREAAVAIGRPLDNTELYVVDGDFQPLPVGVPGELLIGGVGLADGYHERPALTAAAFVPHPFSEAPGARLYRTGDLARWRNDGELEFLGRTDHQLKIRGFRVEPGEIESCLNHHPGVRTSVVSAHFDSAGVGKLIAYVVVEPGYEASRAGIREHLSARLPAYLVPSSFVFLDALPLTPNGKIDRRALPTPGAGTGEPVPPPNRYLAPRDGLEATLVGLWREVLEVDRVGVNDDFFELGGHSLSATRLVALLERATDARVRLRDLFHAPTPAALAVILRARLEAGATAPVAGSDALNPPSEPIVPASPKELEMLDE